MSSIRQSGSSSALSSSSTNSNSSNTSRSSSNAAHPASEPTPQYPPPVHRRSKSAEKDTSISTTPNSPLSSYSPSSFPHHHHKDASSTSQLSANEPLIRPVKANNKKRNRGCMAQFDFTYSGLYVSGSQYGRKTLGTGTGAGGSGECVIM